MRGLKRGSLNIRYRHLPAAQAVNRDDGPLRIQSAIRFDSSIFKPSSIFIYSSTSYEYMGPYERNTAMRPGRHCHPVTTRKAESIDEIPDFPGKTAVSK
jgi:hypothetical protein